MKKLFLACLLAISAIINETEAVHLVINGPIIVNKTNSQLVLRSLNPLPNEAEEKCIKAIFVKPMSIQSTYVGLKGFTLTAQISEKEIFLGDFCNLVDADIITVTESTNQNNKFEIFLNQHNVLDKNIFGKFFINDSRPFPLPACYKSIS